MQFFDQRAVAQALPYPLLIEGLAKGLQEPIEAPERSHFEPNHDDSTVLIMPAWKMHEKMGVKLVSVWPGNSALGLSAVSGVYVLISCADGRPIAVMDGTELTLRRTAAAAALAARILARPDSRVLAVLGTGALSVPLVLAHTSAMKFSRIMIWGRNSHKAQNVVEQLAALGIVAEVATDLQYTMSQADVVAAATTATTPFIRTEWVRPGSHLGLIGAFTAKMSEAEPSLMQHAQVFADSHAAVVEKGGEVFQAIRSGLITESEIQAQLSTLALMPAKAWRKDDKSVTVFKSVGFAALDLIAAELVFKDLMKSI